MANYAGKKEMKRLSYSADTRDGWSSIYAMELYGEAVQTDFKA
jgi:hypothetical protein